MQIFLLGSEEMSLSRWAGDCEEHFPAPGHNEMRQFRVAKLKVGQLRVANSAGDNSEWVNLELGQLSGVNIQTDG